MQIMNWFISERVELADTIKHEKFQFQEEQEDLFYI